MSTIAAAILGFLYGRNSEKGIRTWKIIGIIFLIVYGVLPYFGGIVTLSALMLINILHLVAGVPLLVMLPKKV